MTAEANQRTLVNKQHNLSVRVGLRDPVGVWDGREGLRSSLRPKESPHEQHKLADTPSPRRAAILVCGVDVGVPALWGAITLYRMGHAGLPDFKNLVAVQRGCGGVDLLQAKLHCPVSVVVVVIFLVVLRWAPSERKD